MTASIFKKAIVISVLGHMTAFSIFSFSFGHKLPMAGEPRVYFWGAILPPIDLEADTAFTAPGMQNSLIRRPYLPARPERQEGYPSRYNYYFKPASKMSFDSDKSVFAGKTGPSIMTHRVSQEIMFYPALPYHFLLYFKDRQIAHIELEFKITEEGERGRVAIKRKISSGNLEADLLAMRYISHYLFIQQGAFWPDKWQTVKIELSPKN